jgi:hypothetical protein
MNRGMRPAKLVLIAAFLSAAGTSAIAACAAESPDGTFTYTVIGSRSCETWIEARRNERSKEVFKWVQATAAKSWLVGFLSGMNATSATPKFDFLDAMDADTATLWMDKYCRENPTESMSAGGRQLFRNLEKITRPARQ